MFLEVLPYGKGTPRGRAGAISPSLAIHKKGYLLEVSFISLEWALRSINVYFLAFLDGFKALMVHEEDSFVLVDPGSPE